LYSWFVAKFGTKANVFHAALLSQKLLAVRFWLLAGSSWLRQNGSPLIDRERS